MGVLKILSGLVLAGLSLTAVAWPFSNSVAGWSVQFYAPRNNCVQKLKFAWGDFSFFNELGAASNSKICGMTGNIGGITWKMPAEPLTVSWDDSNGVHHQHSLNMRSVTRGAQVYGGAIELRLVKGQVEVWVAEPKVQKETRLGYLLWQPYRLHYTTASQEAAP